MLHATAAALILLLSTAAAHGAFPGDNGPVAGGWSSSVNRWDEDIGDVVGVAERGVRAFYGDRKELLVGCEVTSPHMADLRKCGDRTIAQPAFSADGRRVAFTTWREIGIAELADPNAIRYIPNPGGRELVHSPAFAPAGDRIAFTVGRDRPTIWIASADGSRQRPLLAGSHPDWSVRGWIAFTRRGQVYRVRPDGTGLRQLTRRGGFSPTWAPGGRKLAFMRSSKYADSPPVDRRPLVDGGVFVLDVRTGRLVQEVSVSRMLRWDADDVVWSPDGSQFAILGESLWTWDRERKRLDVLEAIVTQSGAEASYNLLGIDWQPLP